MRCWFNIAPRKPVDFQPGFASTNGLFDRSSRRNALNQDPYEFMCKFDPGLPPRYREIFVDPMQMTGSVL